MPRYLPKAGLACERMQHMGMTIAMIRSMMRAVWSVPAGATEQSESALRDVFHLLDTTGDGSLDDSELLAVLPLLGETVPPEVLSRLFEQVDNDAGGTIDASEFVRFVRLANPHDEGEPDGWQAFLPAAAANTEEMVLLHVSDGPGRAEGRMRVGDDGRNWRIIPFDELDFVRRSASQPWSTSLVLPRSDLHNAEETIQGLRRLGFVASDILVVVRALFVTQTDADYARVFQVFDRDHTGGIDPFEFRAILALLGDHTTEAEARELFLEADGDNDGVLDVVEFTKLLKAVSPKARDLPDAQGLRQAIANERLRERIIAISRERADPRRADTQMQLLVLGASHVGKTYLLNQVLEEKLPKGATVSTGVGAMVVELGNHAVAVQVIDVPGDPRFAPLGTLFYHTTPYLMLMYDVTSFETFSALQPLLDQFRRANPACRPAEHVVLVANEARVGMKHAVSPGLALEWCEENGDIPYFEVDPEVPQGVLEPLRFLADEFLTAQPLEQGYPTSGSESDRLKARSMPMRAAPAAAPAAQPHGPSDVGTGGRVLKGALKGTRWSRVSERLGNGLSGGATAAANNGSPSQKVSWTKVLTQVSRS